MELTDRDKKILKHIYKYDGFVAKTEVWQVMRQARSDDSPPLKSDRTISNRVNLLCDNKYLKPHLTTKGIYYCLGYRGACWVADHIKKTSLSDILWRRSPPGNLSHDECIQTIHQRFEAACSTLKKTKLQQVMYERELNKFKDKVYCILPNGYQYTREAIPDMFVQLSHRKREYRFLIEQDESSTRDPKLTKDKLIPALEYVHSDVLKNYTTKPIRWLWFIRNAGIKRLLNIKSKIETLGHQRARSLYPNLNDAHNIMLTLFDEATPQTLLTEPIWYKPYKQHPVVIFEA